MKKFDAVVIGAGTIGLSAAISLAKNNFKVLVLEKLPKHLYNKPGRVGRLYAISSGSQKLLLKHCGLPKKLPLSQVIKRIIIRDISGSGNIDFNPKDIDAKHFGVMLDELALNEQLYDIASSKQDIEFRFGVELDSLDAKTGELSTDIAERYKASAILITDGRQSTTKAYLGIESIRHDFSQIACVFEISHSVNHNGTAYEVFTPQGPFAILPKVGGHTSSIVWTMPSKFKDFALAMSVEDLAEMTTERLEGELGYITISSERAIFHLASNVSKEYHNGRVLLVGDALHSIHPMAGQGLNLSMRDLDYVIDTLVKCKKNGVDPYYSHSFENYSRDRLLDNEIMNHGMILLDNVMSVYSPVFAMSRNIGMHVVDSIPQLKALFMKYASGASQL